MNKKESSIQDEPKPVEQTTQADEQKSEQKAEVSAPLPVINPPDAEEPKPSDSYDETDRKQDEAIDELAEQTKYIAQQTKWMAEQTTWVKRQAIFSVILGAITLGVLIYHGFIMGRQSQAAREQTNIMKGQLESMNSSSRQTQDLIDATRGTANASQSVAEQNKELVAHAGEQSKASLAQAEAAKQSIGAAQTSARAAEQTARIAQESFYIGDRPYVSAGYLDVENFEAGVQPRVSVVFSNTGKTPAIDVKAAAKISIGASPSPNESTSDKYISFEPSIPGMPTGSIFTLPAGEKMAFFVEGKEALTKTAVEEIKNGKMFLFVFGVAFYKDGLGKSHELRYCMFYSPADDIFIACPDFNSTN